jgi:PPOX class probable F420-dependent enzyme
MTDAVAQFAKAKYFNLETFRKSGMGVRTPVWFAQSGDGSRSGRATFYIYSEANAGKVKRIRNNPKVRIAPCNFRGALDGAWVEGRARLCTNDEVAQGQELLRRKYFLKIVGDFFGRLMRHKNAVIAIELD